MKLVLDDLEDEEVFFKWERAVVEMEIYLVWIVPFSELLNVHEESYFLLSSQNVQILRVKSASS